eukprot:1003067_1
MWLVLQAIVFPGVHSNLVRSAGNLIGDKTLLQTFSDFCIVGQPHPNVFRDTSMDVLVHGFLRKIDSSLQHRFDTRAIQWWQSFNAKQFVGSLDILSDVERLYLLIISYLQPEDMKKKLIDFLQQPDAGANSQMLIPGSNVFYGRECPISMQILANLSLACRVFLCRELLYRVFVRKHIPGIGIVETAVRLFSLCTASLSSMPATLRQYLLDFRESERQYMIIETVYYRLFRPLMHCGGLRYIFEAIVTKYPINGPRELTQSYQALLIKMCLFPGFGLVPSRLNNAHQSIVVFRCLFVGMARALAIRYPYHKFHANLPDVIRILEITMCTHQADKHEYSENTKKYLPQILQQKLKDRFSRIKVTRFSWRQAQEQAELSWMHRFRILKQDAPSLTEPLEYFRNDPNKQRFVFSGLAHLELNGKNINAKAVHILLNMMLPRALSIAVFTLIDTVLSYLFENRRKDSEGALDNLESEAASCLSRFVWVYKFFSMDICLLALADRDDDSASFRIINHILNGRQMLERLEFTKQHSMVDHWKENNHARQHAQYYERFPEIHLSPCKTILARL